LPLREKLRLTSQLADWALPRFADGRLRPVIDTVLPWTEANEAHARMESDANVGKIVLRVQG
ncbi:putative NADPH:quinone oxidoreductase, partial [Paenibacillus sp. 598K]|uniref:zinc-binding dehydrogenase n=1 Tax=Paenibacillus sp. 598K TaxID=1117987 RepID=UPI000FFA8AB7